MKAGISFRESSGLWWPNYDHDPEKCLRFVTKGLTDMDLTIDLCRQKRVCIQAGGHVGLWPKRLAQNFNEVYTFECEPELFACMQLNLKDIANIKISGKALGAFVGEARMRSSVSAGGWSIDVLGKLVVQQTTIDALGLNHVDALFLDVEAYEVEVLRGAAKTIKRCKPVIHVEELPRSKEAIRAHMAGLGYTLRRTVHSDAIYTCTRSSR